MNLIELCNRCKFYNVLTSKFSDIPIGSVGLLVEKKPEWNGVALLFPQQQIADAAQCNRTSPKDTIRFFDEQEVKSVTHFLPSDLALLQAAINSQEPKQTAIQPIPLKPYES